MFQLHRNILANWTQERKKERKEGRKEGRNEGKKTRRNSMAFSPQANYTD
jgi:hypothetical protein